MSSLLPAVVRQHRTASLLAGIAAVALGLFAWRALGTASLDLAVAARHDLVRSVVASGHVETPNRVAVGATVTGQVRRVAVREGDAVVPGQVMIELDDVEARASAAQAEAAVAQAEAKLRQLDEVQRPVASQTLAQAEVTLAHARRTLERDQALQAQGFIGPAALDESRKAVELATAQRDAAQHELASAGAHGSDRDAAIAALAQARAAADAARARLADRRVLATVAGTVIDRQVDPGDVVQPGRTLLTLSPAVKTQLIVELDEKHLGVLAVGQAAQASADAFADRRFAARVAEISPAVNPQSGAVEVKLDVPQAPDYLRQDMTVSIDIAVATRRDALVVPAEAVHDIDGPAPWVWRVVDGRASRRPVTPGLRGGAVVEVVSGLAAGDTLVARGDASVREGQRVRAPGAPGVPSAAAASPASSSSSSSSSPSPSPSPSPR